MKKVYFCFILTLILILSACSKVKMPKTDEILEPIVSETIDTDGSSAVDNSDEVNDPKDEELNPVDTNTVDVIDDNDDDDIDDDQGDTISQDTTEEVFKTRVAISTTGKEVVLQIPNTTKIIISNNNGIKVDKVEVANLEKLMNSFDSNVSFFYIDLKTGLTMEARADIKYASASVIKAPFVKSVLESGADLNEKIAIKKQDYHGGSGTLQYQPVGTLYTVKDLIKYTIEDSDNVAYNMLCRRFGFDQFSSNAIKLGINADQAANLKFGHLSSRDAALYFQDIYNYANEGNENGQLLVDNLINAKYDKLLKTAFPQYDVAEKFGLVNSDILYHTAAIIYSENPYVISIFSNLDETDGKAAMYINQIATSIDKIHNSQK
jgi:hypothetical protein